MDQYYNHYQSYNQWRQPSPPPQQPSLCPVCSIPHLPICPPHPPPYHHQNPNYPQHHNYARPVFDPYQPPPPPPPPPPAPAPPPPPPYVNGFADSRSWHPNPNSDHDYATAGVGELDRSYKRPRIEDIGSAPARISKEDERRLKLIRDHGAASFSGVNKENKSPHFNINNDNNVNLMPPRSSEMYNIEDSLNNCTGYYGNNNYSQPQLVQQKDSMPTAINHWQGYEQRIGGHLPHPGGNHMAQPPLPASPPPPLPVEAYSSSPSSSVSLFPLGDSSSVTAHSSYPVAIEPYYQNKPPHASGGFHREDPQVIHRSSSVKYGANPPKQLSSDKPKVLMLPSCLKCLTELLGLIIL
ncbi:P-loop containing nucleoside triphosphate hydrolases superfamily protein [Hibiscus syriacus]|uniref:P-loop containing nucleoside triphosphate hydrolases superfamily protein n=1 Tax=Hibiscus syriacus TaxID=106335 RepID=A0A6A2WMZ8_HIBSY|nr:P-loop containing nucleoside triphosphate hydrolases superfamily protein [Hibiscus syriacus]